MDIYLIFVVILFALAISDLVVGVSNDAVNFLNSALGSKVAPYNVIMIIASLGILVGATFSNGMMEVARKGIFHPQHFYFTEIMVIFMAVMITDILLLDFFNTIGMPTSTTVSIVFELLGAAVAVSVIKIKQGAQTIFVDGVERVAHLSDYINSAKALTIIGGILLSVVVAFGVGLFVMWITRVVFSFKMNKSIKYFGALWGGIAIAAITYFILIKGAKGASFMSSDAKAYIRDNWVVISLASFAIWTVLLQVLRWLFKINILKVVVLVGTFALAMAFAGNDLVNFIGVPLAAFESYKMSGGDEQMLMDGMAAKVATPTIYLIIAGLIMVVTLWMSKKARSVTETELSLARQDEGQERFGASVISRLLVRRAVNTSLFFNHVLPQSFINKIKGRFDQTPWEEKLKDDPNPPMFDLLRASVNLTVASILISLATSYKLPLSTTYVTFMVAMGTSLADGAWGRDSAVYRITGVFAVVGGWFLTALIAFTVAFIIAVFIYWGGIYAVLLLAAFAAFAVYKTTRLHKKREEDKKALLEELAEEDESSAEKVMEKCNKGVSNVLLESAKIFEGTINGLAADDEKALKKQASEAKKLNKKTKKQKDNLLNTISLLQEDSIETGHYYVQVLDYQREMAHCVNFIVEPAYEHVANKHKSIVPEQGEELKAVSKSITAFYNNILTVVKSKSYDKFDDILKQQEIILDDIQVLRKKQLKRIKNKETGTKNSMLYLNTLNEARHLALYAVNVLKAQRDFVTYTQEIK